MLRVWRTHHPYADFFFFGWRVSWLRMPRIQKHRWRKTSLLACCLRLVYWLKVDSKSLHLKKLCREATRCKHWYRAWAPSRWTSTQGSGARARSAPRGRVTECGAPDRALHHDHVLCVHRKNGAVMMNIPVEQVKNLKKEQDGGKRSSLLFSTNFSSRILAHQICCKVCACRSRSLLSRRLRSWSGRFGRSKVVEVFRRLRDSDPVEIEKNFRCSTDNLVVSSTSTVITCGRQGDVCARVITLRDSHQHLQQCAEMASGLFHADSLLAQERKKNRLSCACGQWWRQSEHLTFFFFSRGSVVAKRVDD